MNHAKKSISKNYFNTVLFCIRIIKYHTGVRRSESIDKIISY